MPIAPTNSGFTAKGTGWVRLRLANDDPQIDVWVIDGRFYPLKVADYEFVAGGQVPSELIFDEGAQRGGYTRSVQLDEAPYANLPSNVGLYSGAAGAVSITARGGSPQEVTLAAGDFFAQDVEAVDFVEGSDVTYLVLVKP